MGLIACYRCPDCDYDSGELYLGFGMGSATSYLDFDKPPDSGCAELVSCPSCKTLRTKDRNQVPTGCRSHRRAYRLYESDDVISCPKCGGESRADSLGLWD